MSKKIKGFTVTLEMDLAEDDIRVKVIMNAIKAFRGVAHVKAAVTTSEDHFARERLRWEIKNKLYMFADKEI
jgi:hypothetical protein